MDADRLQALVIEMLQFRPTTTSEHIAHYIVAKTRGIFVTIAEVNVVLERLADEGGVVLDRPQDWHPDHPQHVSAHVLSAGTDVAWPGPRRRAPAHAGHQPRRRRVRPRGTA